MVVETKCVGVDLFSRLKGKPTVIEKILTFLDHKTLGNIQCVCKSWNLAVHGGRHWDKQLQHQLAVNETLKQIAVQFPDQTGSHAKETLGKLFKAAKRLGQNWLSGHGARKKEVKLSSTFNCNEHPYIIRDMLDMDDQRIVVGAPYQEVFKVFNRKGLTHKKDLNHGKGLRYVKLLDKFIVSVSSGELKMWDKSALTLVETVAIPVSRHEEHGSSSTAFAYGHGLMVFFNNMFGDCFPPSIKLSAWRVVKEKNSLGKVLQSVHSEKFPSSHFIIIEAHVSKNYIIAVLSSSKQQTAKTHNYTVQVRSTVDFAIVHTVKHHGFMLFPVIMVQDCFLLQIEKSDAESMQLKSFDCAKGQFTPVPTFGGNYQIILCGFNSNYGIGYTLNKLASSFDDIITPALLFDNKSNAILSNSGPRKIPLTICPITRLQDIKLGSYFGFSSQDFQDFVVDELSIVQLVPDVIVNRKTREVACKLILVDFIDEAMVACDGPRSDVVTSSCSFCQQSCESMKRCGRCRRTTYCSAECQRMDWDFHKKLCTPSK